MADVLRIEVVISAEKAERGAKRVKKVTDNMAKSLKDAGKAAKDAAKDEKKAAKGTDEFTVAQKKASQAVKELAANVALIQGPLGPVAGRISTLGTMMGRLNPTLIAASIGTVALTFSLKALVSVGSDLEQGMFKLQAVVQATGGTAGFTANEMDTFARGLARATLANTDNVRNAIVKLSTFRSVGGKVFKETLVLAQDLSAAGFGSLETTALSLGRALEDPIRGLSALRRVGVSFSADQEKVIKQFARTGEVAKAQAEMLKVVRVQVEGLARAEAQGLSGAIDAVNQSWTELLQTFSKITGATEGVTALFKGISGGLRGMNEALRDPTLSEKYVSAFVALGKTRGQLNEIKDELKRGNVFFIRRGLLQGHLIKLRESELRQEKALAKAEKARTAEIRRRLVLREKEKKFKTDLRDAAQKKLGAAEHKAFVKLAFDLDVARQGTISLDVAKKRLLLTQQIQNDSTIRNKEAALLLINVMLDQIQKEKELQSAQKKRIKTQNDLAAAERAAAKKRERFATRITKRFDPAGSLQLQRRKLVEVKGMISGSAFQRAMKAANDAYFTRVVALDKLTAKQQYRLTLERQEIALSESKIRVQVALQDGSISEFQLNERLDEITRRKIASLRKELALMDELNIANKLRRGEIKLAITELQGELQRNEKMMRSLLGDSFSSFFEDILDGTGTVKDAFKSLARSIEREINSIVAKQLGAQLAKSFMPVGGGTSGFFGTFLAAISGGSGSAAASGGGAGGGFANVDGFANGGSFRVGGSGGVDSQLVAFRASPNERVTVSKPNQNGGKRINVTNNFVIQAPNGSVSQASQQQVATAAGQAIRVALRRNG